MLPKGWKGVRMRNQKLRNIRPSGAFSLEVTSSNVTSPVGLLLEGWGARMRNRKLCNILSNVTCRASFGTGSHPKGWKGVRMRNQKLRNIRPSGVFSPEVTSSNVTWPRKGSIGKVGCAHAQPKVAQYPPYWGLFTGSDVIRGHITHRASLGRVGCAHAQPEVAQYRSNVTCRAYLGTGSHVIGSVLGVLSRTSASIIF